MSGISPDAGQDDCTSSYCCGWPAPVSAAFNLERSETLNDMTTVVFSF